MKTVKSLIIVVVVAVVGGLLPVGPSLGQTTGPTSAPAPAGAGAGEIEALVEKLSADDYRTRQEAQDQLVRYGTAARPYLERLAATAADPEARERAASAVAQIDDDRATGPSMVTLHVKDASPEEVLSELSRQGMYAIPTLPENLFKQEHINWPKVTMDVDRQPFWVAMREFCEKTGLRINAMGGERRFVVMQGGDDTLLGPAVYSGPFMVVANNVTRSSSIMLGRDRTPSKNLNMQFTVYAEPKLNVMGHDYSLRLTEAVDDRGNSLLVPGPAAGYESMGQDASARWSLGASLAIPENLGTRLVRLKGFSRVMMQTKSVTWEVPGVMEATAGSKSPARSIGGRRYVIEELKGVGEETYQMKFTMIREVARLEPWQQYGRGVRVTLLDGEGRALANRGGGGGGSDEKLTYTYTFSRETDGGVKTGPAAKAVVEVPTEVKEVEVPFEFKDLPLP